MVEISCLEVWRELSNYIDDDVHPELRHRMEEHFKGCAHCSAILDGSRNVVHLVGDGHSFPLPPSTRLYDKLRADLARRKK